MQQFEPFETQAPVKSVITDALGEELRNADGMTLDDARQEFLEGHLKALRRQSKWLYWCCRLAGVERVLSTVARWICVVGLPFVIVYASALVVLIMPLLELWLAELALFGAWTGLYVGALKWQDISDERQQSLWDRRREVIEEIAETSRQIEVGDAGGDRVAFGSGGE